VSEEQKIACCAIKMTTINRGAPSSLTLIALMLLAVCSCSASTGIDISQINVNDIQQKLPSEFANMNLTNLEDAKSLLRDKCIKVAGEEQGNAAFEEIEASGMSLMECISGIVNFTNIQAEIDEASPRGELDVVFNKYCNKRPEAVVCIETFNLKLVPCLEKDEQENQDVVMRIIRSLLNFICHKGGDQIALFIAEKGPECLESKKTDIEQCINSTFNGYMPKEGLENIKTLPKFVMGPKQCKDMENLEACVVDKLEKCTEITPANIVESMFRFIKNETICRNGPKGSQQSPLGHSSSAGGNSSMISLNAITFALVFAVILSFSKKMQI